MAGPGSKCSMFQIAISPALVLLPLLALALPTEATQGSSREQRGQVEAGRRLYMEGLRPSGQPLRATLQGDIQMEGVQFRCRSCHQGSGFGSNEAAGVVFPITAAALYQPRRWRRGDNIRKLYQEVQPRAYAGRLRDPRARSAYTDETLARALREGLDADGHSMDPMMPRYELDDDEMAALIAYIKTIEPSGAPGVDQEELHLATVITADTPPAQAKAVVDVLEAYVERKNRYVENEFARPGHSPYYKNDFYSAYRRWVLHVWRLSGPMVDWRKRLDAYYREQPVFAVVGGASPGSWASVHDFCEAQRVPCLFPLTDLPVVSQEGDWTVYFSRGITLEAESLGHFLRQTRHGAVLQVSDTGPKAAVAVHALAASLQDAPGLSLERATFPSSPADPADAHGAAGVSGRWQRLLAEHRPRTLVLWLEHVALEPLAEAIAKSGRAVDVVLSSGVFGDALPTHIPASMAGHVLATYPYALPGDRDFDTLRIRAWLNSRGVARQQERSQLATYFAASIVDHALVHIVDNFSRPFFLEEVEHEAEQGLTQSVYPHLSLGPGQRFASKGCYLVRLVDGQPIEPVSDWIVP